MSIKAFFRLGIIFVLLITLGVTAVAAQTPTNTPEPLSITAVAPSTIVNNSETELVISGTGFQNGAVVLLTSYGALATTYTSQNVLRAVVPIGVPSGVYTLTVVNPNSVSTSLAGALTISVPATTPEPQETATPIPSQTPGATPFVRPLIVVNSYGASSAELTPGENFDFEMTLVNAGQIRASNVVATFVPGSFIPRATGGVRAIGALDPGQNNRFWQPLFASRDLAGQNTGTLEVKVDYTDAQGTAYSESFTLSFAIAKVASGGVAASPTPTVTATVGPRLRPQLLITSSGINVPQLEPGVNFALELTVQNQGNANARRVTMILGGGSSSGGLSGTPEAGGLSGASGSFTDFAPVGSSNVQFLGDLDQGALREASQALIVNASTKPGAYPVKVSFVYHDEQNVNYVDDQVVTLLVYQRPSVDFNFYSPVLPLFAGQPGSLPLQLVNSGKTTAVLGTFSVTAVGATFENSSIYVGSLEPGGFFPLDALVYPDQLGPLDLELSVTYTDDFNQPQTLTKTLSVEVLEAFMPEEPTEEFPPEGEIPAEPEPETFEQKIWRFILGFLGLSSGVPQPAQPGFPLEGELVPPEGGFEAVPPGFSEGG